MKMANKNQQSRRWAFLVRLAHVEIIDGERTRTESNKDEIDSRTNQIAGNDQIVGLIIGVEKGTKSQDPHYPGYLETHTNKTIGQMRSLINREMHWEIAQESRNDNQQYCEKQADRQWTKGFATSHEKIRMEREQRWLEILQDAKVMNDGEFSAKCPGEWILRRSAIERIMIESAQAKAQKWDGNLQDKNIWLSGAPGVGKSRWADSQRIGFAYDKKNVNQWWNAFDPRRHLKVTVEDCPCRPQGDCLQHHLEICADR
jgi:hypothetical protein